MRFETLLSAALATLATATTIPIEARAFTATLTCQEAALGPLLNQFRAAISSLSGHDFSGDVYTLPAPNTCARVATYGTAGLNLCGSNQPGTPTTAFKYRDLIPYFNAIANGCASADNGIWTRANGGYLIDSTTYPNGTVWAYVYTEAIGPLGP